MLAALGIGYLLAGFLCVIAPLIPRRRAGDLALFPYNPEGDPGSRLRFHIFLPLMQEEGLSYRLFSLGTVDPARYGALDRPYWTHYRSYAINYYRRLAQVLEARNYRAAFVQRGLFPYYPRQTFAHLGRLLKRLNPDVTVDFYDADYVHNTRIVDSTVRYAHRVTVVNEHLLEHFRRLHPQVSIFPLALDVGQHPVKEDYALSNPVKLFWWGSPTSALPFREILPSLRRVAGRHPLELVIVCSEDIHLDGVPVVCHRWDPATAFGLLRSADIGVSPMDDSERSRGGVAMKVFEFMATALPVVSSPFALSPHARDEEHLLVARDLEGWERALQRLISSQELRRRLGRAGRAMLLEHHTPEAVYPALKHACLPARG
jgi:glycosyltransferase involved in cell wall biosynthesis